VHSNLKLKKSKILKIQNLAVRFILHLNERKLLKLLNQGQTLINHFLHIFETIDSKNDFHYANFVKYALHTNITYFHRYFHKCFHGYFHKCFQRYFHKCFHTRDAVGNNPHTQLGTIHAPSLEKSIP